MVQISFAEHMAFESRSAFNRTVDRLSIEAEDIGGYDYEEEEHYADQMEMELEDIFHSW